MSILNNVADRALWLATSARIIVIVQQLETQISIAMLDRPTHQQARMLLDADAQLGEAATALTEAAAKIRGLT
jgi:hypothetical protein